LKGKIGNENLKINQKSFLPSPWILNVCVLLKGIEIPMVYLVYIPKPTTEHRASGKLTHSNPILSMITECGVFAVVSRRPSAAVVKETIAGLELLQHRGREAAGVAYHTPGGEVRVAKREGLVKDVFGSGGVLEPGANPDPESQPSMCIGHVRYSTSGSKASGGSPEHIQPYSFQTLGENFALVYNGNIKNINGGVEKFRIERSITIDTTLIVEILKRIDKPTMGEKLAEFVQAVSGVYCLIVLGRRRLYAARDAFGVRPFCVAQNDRGFCLSSESCAIQDYAYLRNVEPGEVLSVDQGGITTLHRHAQPTQSKCIFEYIYFMNAQSHTSNSERLETVRYMVGAAIAAEDRKLAPAQEFDYNTTLVCGCPQTGIAYGTGYAQGSSLRYRQFLKKDQVQNRTFILPFNEDRIVSIQKNLYIDGDIRNKDLILLDDSLVRGNTMRNVIEKLKENGAKSVHVRITSPPVRFPCYFGVDIPSYEELIASRMTIEKIRESVGADTLRFTPLEVFYTVLGESGFCSACFDGQYKKELLEW
jgi:amidophosphoribosyltransferase